MYSENNCTCYAETIMFYFLLKYLLRVSGINVASALVVEFIINYNMFPDSISIHEEKSLIKLNHFTIL